MRRTTTVAWKSLMAGLAGCCLLAAAAGKLVPFEKNGKWGYRSEGGAVRIAPRYDNAGEFSAEGLAAVADRTGWAYIDARGRAVIRPFVFDNGPDPFEDGLARFVRAGKFGYFDRTGRVAIQPAFDFAAPFSEGLAAFCNGCKETPDGEHRIVKGGRWGFLDKSGRVAIEARFDEARSFQGGRAEVLTGGRWTSVNKEGKPN